MERLRTAIINIFQSKELTTVLYAFSLLISYYGQARQGESAMSVHQRLQRLQRLQSPIVNLSPVTTYSPATPPPLLALCHYRES